MRKEGGKWKKGIQKPAHRTFSLANVTNVFGYSVFTKEMLLNMRWKDF